MILDSVGSAERVASVSLEAPLSLSLVVTAASESRLTHMDGLELLRGDGDPGGMSKPSRLPQIGESEACLSAVCLYLWKNPSGGHLEIKAYCFPL